MSDTGKVSYHTTDPFPVHTYSEIVMLKVYILLRVWGRGLLGGVYSKCPLKVSGWKDGHLYLLQWGRIYYGRQTRYIIEG